MGMRSSVPLAVMSIRSFSSVTARMAITAVGSVVLILMTPLLAAVREAVFLDVGALAVAVLAHGQQAHARPDDHLCR